MSTAGGQREDPDEVERRFREIVAGLDESPEDVDPTAALDDRPEPGSEDDPAAPVEEQKEKEEEKEPPPGGQEDPAPRRASHLGPGTPAGMATDFRSYEAYEDPDDDHFIPPPTPPLPVGDLHFWAIVGCLVGGPALLLFSAVIPVLETAWAAVGLMLTVVGFVLLVLRLPRSRQDDDPGAQV